MEHKSSQIFNALGDPTRRALFESLARLGASNVTTLTKGSGVSQPMVSRHLAGLRAAGLVVERREGREHFYSVRPNGLIPLTDWVSEQTAFWEAKLDALDDLLGRLDN